MIARNSKFMLIVSLLICVASTFATLFLYKLIQKNSAASIEVGNRVSEFNSQLRNLKIFENFVSSTASEREKVDSIFVKQNDQNDFLNFVKDLENAGSDIGLNVNVESSSQAFGGSDKGPALHLVTEGSFSQIFKYSLMLENLQYEIMFESINFSKRDGDIWKGDYVIRLLSYEL